MRLTAGGTYACDPRWTQPTAAPAAYWRIYAPVSGSATIVVGGVGTPLEPGQLYLIPSHPAVQQRCVRRMLVHWMHAVPDRPLAAALAGVRTVHAWPVAAYPHAVPVLARAAAAIGGMDALASSRLLALAQELCAAAGIAVRARPTPPLPFPVASALRVLEQAFPRDPGAAALARAAAVSAVHLRRAFRAALGDPPHAYLARRRIAEAARQLAEGDAPIAQIAADCGFEDAFYFARIFRRRMGLSPRAYRNARRQAP